VYNKYDFSDRLNALLRKRGMTQTQLSEIIDVSIQSINKYCQGTEAPQKIEILMRLSNLFDVSIDYLIGKPINIYSKEFDDLFYEYMKREYIKMKMEETQTPNGKLPMMYISQRINFGIYPHCNAAFSSANSQANNNTYKIINGNICREDIVVNEKEYISIYEYASAKNNLEPYKKAYQIERYSMGLIGKLSADKFFMLNYVIGYYIKNQKNNN
jgi:transcriptional regulator with XRE-family HTH domain